jgi:hypothetical protein
MLALRKNGFRTALVTMGLLAVVSTSPANASLVLTGSPVAGSIPGGGSNELLSDPVLFPPGSGSTGGFFGADIVQSGNAKLKFDFLGFEAGFANAFVSLNFGPQVFSTETFAPSNNTHATSLNSPLQSFTINGVNGLLSFFFGTPAGVVINGSNPGFDSVNFFTSQRLDGTLVLWLDDSGAGPDTDYDDMVVRISEISEVPLPPALLLFGSGLLGMNWLRRRRQNLFG